MPWDRPSEAAEEPGRPAHRSAPVPAGAAEAVPRAAVRPSRSTGSGGGGGAIGSTGGGGGGTGAAIASTGAGGGGGAIGSTGGGGGGTGAAIATTGAGGGGGAIGSTGGGGGGTGRPSRRTALAGEVAAEQRGWAAEAAAGCSGWRSHRRRRCGGSGRRADRRMTARHPCPDRQARARRQRSVLPWRPGMQRRKLAAAVAAPGARRELKPAVISVAGVDGPVAAGFAAWRPDPIHRRWPRWPARRVRDLQLPMTAPVKAIFATFTADAVGLRCRPLIGACVSSLRRPRGQLSGSGWRGCPAGGVETMPASPQGAEISSRSFYFGGPVGPPPPSKVVRC